MDTLLITVTALSILMASAMAVVVLKLLRDERRRSDARVAALTELANIEPPVQRSSRQPDLALRRERADIDLDLRADGAEVAGVGQLFAEPERTSPWGARLAVVGTIVAVVAAGGFALPRVLARSGPAPEAAVAAPAAPQVTQPIELLSLSYTQENGRLVVSGMVMNPRGSSSLARTVATAFAFSADGSLLGSGRAPLDFTTLGPGEESPFVVTVPVSGEVTRYRVGFRTEEGSTIAHVDRRGS